MKQGAIRILQSELSAQGLYAGPVNAQLNATLTASVAGVIENRRGDLSGDPTDWSDARKRVAVFQLICADAAFDPGPADGLWGQRTEFAYGQFSFFIDTGERPISFRDIVPLDVNPHGWPRDHGDQSELFDFFDFNPNAGGDPATLAVTCPWELKLDWDRSVKTSRIGCHPKLAQSLESILTKIHDHYGTDALVEMGMNIYGGCKNVRTKRGGSTWSTHSFAAAIDWDPGRNKLDWGWREARMARPDFLPFWQFWEEEGWLSLGRTRNFDWMHVQAIKI